MKTINQYVAGLILLLSLNGCTEYTPSGVATLLAESLKTGDYSKVLSLTAPNSTQEQDVIHKLSAKREKDFSHFGGIKRYKIIGELVTPDESKAFVRIEYTFQNNQTKEELIVLVKSGGYWKLQLQP